MGRVMSWVASSGAIPRVIGPPPSLHTTVLLPRATEGGIPSRTAALPVRTPLPAYTYGHCSRGSSGGECLCAVRLIWTYTHWTIGTVTGHPPPVRHLLGPDPARCATVPLRDVQSPAITREPSGRLRTTRQVRPTPVNARARWDRSPVIWGGVSGEGSQLGEGKSDLSPRKQGGRPTLLRRHTSARKGHNACPEGD